MYHLYAVLPVILPFSFESEANSGDNIQATCHVSKGDTPLKLEWRFNGRNASAVTTIKTVEIGEKINVMVIPEVTAFHAGDYTCIAQNRAGVANYTATLMVNGNKIA